MLGGDTPVEFALNMKPAGHCHGPVVVVLLVAFVIVLPAPQVATGAQHAVVFGGNIADALGLRTVPLGHVNCALTLLIRVEAHVLGTQQFVWLAPKMLLAFGLMIVPGPQGKAALVPLKLPQFRSAPSQQFVAFAGDIVVQFALGDVLAGHTKAVPFGPPLPQLAAAQQLV